MMSPGAGLRRQHVRGVLQLAGLGRPRFRGQLVCLVTARDCTRVGRLDPPQQFVCIHARKVDGYPDASGPLVTLPVVPEELSAAVAAEIRRLMDERRLSSNALAKETGLPQTTVYRKVHGKQVIDLNDLPPLAEALGISVTELIARALSGK
jgi:DNA-binding Xre family transcriptional regulator